MIGGAKLIDGPNYFFNGSLPINKRAQALCGISSNPVREEILLWHLRLGLKHLFPSLFKNVDCSSFSCVLAKSHRTTYKSKLYQASKRFHLIHSDVWGPSKVTNVMGERWFVTFIDDHTRLCWLYLIK